MKLKGSKIVQYALHGEEEAGLCASSEFFVCLALRVFFFFFFFVVVVVLFCFVFLSSSWCRGLAAVCNCGTPRTFLLTYLEFRFQQ